MTVRRDVQQLGALELVEMFEWDATAQGDTGVFRWHPGTAVSGAAIVWDGKTYDPFPIEASGFDISVGGKLPRPTLRASNIGGLLGDYLKKLGDALGAKVTRRRTLGKYLDAVNFPGGNPDANPNTGFPDEIFYVARKSLVNGIQVEVELSTKFDVAGVLLPRRQVIASTCQWVYRDPATCAYDGPPVRDGDGNDICHKTLNECRRRFGEHGVLHTSAFPASLLVQQ